MVAVKAFTPPNGRYFPMVLMILAVISHLRRISSMENLLSGTIYLCFDPDLLISCLEDCFVYILDSFGIRERNK